MTRETYLIKMERQLYTVICRSRAIQLNRRMKHQFYKLINNARIMALENNKEEAEKYIKEAEEYLKKCQHEIRRRWYIIFGTTIFSAIMLICLEIKNICVSNFVQYMEILEYGSMGVFLSILRHASYSCNNYINERKQIFWQIITKYVIGMFSALLAIEAFKAGIFLTDFVSPEHNKEFLLLLGVTAGYNEKIVSLLIYKIETIFCLR